MELKLGDGRPVRYVPVSGVILQTTWPGPGRPRGKDRGHARTIQACW